MRSTASSALRPPTSTATNPPGFALPASPSSTARDSSGNAAPRNRPTPKNPSGARGTGVQATAWISSCTASRGSDTGLPPASTTMKAGAGVLVGVSRDSVRHLAEGCLRHGRQPRRIEAVGQQRRRVYRLHPILVESFQFTGTADDPLDLVDP